MLLTFAPLDLHLHGCDARNDGRHSDSDVELVRSGFDLLEDILAAYVSVRCLRNRENAEEQEEEQAKGRGDKLHRCTLRIQRPKLKPIQVLIEP